MYHTAILNMNAAVLVTGLRKSVETVGMRARGYHKPQSRCLKMNQADQPRKVPRGIHWVGLAPSLCCPTKLQLQQSTNSAFHFS